MSRSGASLGVCRVVLQVTEKLDSLQAERERLEDHWKKKQSWLEAVHLEQVFYRDVGAMDKTSNSQEVHGRAPSVRSVDTVLATRNPPGPPPTFQPPPPPDPAAERHPGRDPG